MPGWLCGAGVGRTVTLLVCRWCLSFLWLFVPSATTFGAESVWRRHTIDASSQGADGVRLPLEIDGRNGTDLVIGSKGEGAEVGWLKSPPEPRKLSEWTWHRLSEAGWIMSLIAEDMDGDGDVDVLLTDRRGKQRGCRWLENPGSMVAARGETWRSHLIGANDVEVMFAALQRTESAMFIHAATSRSGILSFERVHGDMKSREVERIAFPDGVGRGKSVVAADFDLDGVDELAVSCEHADGKHGVYLLDRRGGEWEFRPISGDDAGTGIKFDLLQLADLDGDGDLDLLTCEERDQLGVVWYENPSR